MKIKKKIAASTAEMNQTKVSPEKEFISASDDYCTCYGAAVSDVRAAISDLAKCIGNDNDEFVKECIANLSVVLFDLTSNKQVCNNSSSVDEIEFDVAACDAVEADEEVEYWSVDVESLDDVIAEIDKALAAGTTLEDIEDYLKELADSDKLTGKEYITALDYAKDALA